MSYICETITIWYDTNMSWLDGKICEIWYDVHGCICERMNDGNYDEYYSMFSIVMSDHWHHSSDELLKPIGVHR